MQLLRRPLGILLRDKICFDLAFFRNFVHPSRQCDYFPKGAFSKMVVRNNLLTLLYRVKLVSKLLNYFAPMRIPRLL